MELRPARADEFDAFSTAVLSAFHEELTDDERRRYMKIHEPDRSLAWFDGDAIVGTSSLFTRTLTVPGAQVPVGAVTAVAVLPTHRRRGLLTGMMRRQLENVRDAGEPIAALWASEGAIYGRFGFGLATRSLRYDLHTDRVALRADAPLPQAPVQTLEPATALERIRPLYDRVRTAVPGMLDRHGAWWEKRIHDPEHDRDGAGPLRAAVQPGPDGEPAGYALFAAKANWDDHGPAGSVNVRELVAETPEAQAGLWRFLLGLDLVRTLQWRLAPDHAPLVHLAAGNDAINRRAGDGLFIRLLDVDAALSARTYATGVDLVLDVDDPYCPWNTGRHRLRDGRCEPTDDPADLALGAEALGAIYLGGTPVTALAGAGRVRELREGALTDAAAAFRSPVEPWCPEIF